MPLERSLTDAFWVQLAYGSLSKITSNFLACIFQQIKTVNVLVEDEAGIFPLAANQTRSLYLIFHIYFRPNQPLHTKRNNQPHQPSTYQSHVNDRPHGRINNFSRRHRKLTETSPTPILLLKSQWPSPLVYEGIGEEGTPDPVGHTTPILIGA